MGAARWDRGQAIFHAALDKAETDRRVFLETECTGDPQLLAEVRALLEQDERGHPVLDESLAGLAHEVLDGSVPLLRTVGPYRVLRVLGQGGMGVVYLAERAELRHRVAIKVLRDAALSLARRERFEREQQTLAQLNHPSIARLYDADVLPDGTPYFVMEYVEGVPLTQYCQAHGASLTERLRLFREVCEAVQHAHRQAIIHRDLKPSNILVADPTEGAASAGKGSAPDSAPREQPTAGRPVVKLLDFGIAKQLESLDTASAQTQTGLRLMTPAYGAPEQLRGEPVGVYTDVYALGVILYELLTGVLPYDVTGLTPAQLEARLLESGPVSPSTRVARTAETPSTAARAPAPGRAAWADLDVLCLTAMHRDPQRRYATVEALLRDVDHFLRGEPLEARPDTVGYRLGKFVRRNRRRVAGAALVAAALSSLTIFHTVQLREERDRAQLEAQKAEQVSEYLIGLFEASDPLGLESDSLDLRTLLERGEVRAEELVRQPELQAQMLDVLGRIHTRLSNYERAETLLDRALAVRRHLDPNGLDVAQTLANLGSLYRFQGRLDAAEDALRESLAIREGRLPPQHSAIAATLDALGVVLNQKGAYEDAEALLRLALNMRRAIYEEPHEMIAYSLNNLGAALYQQGRYAAAEPLFRESIALIREVYGPDHAEIAMDLANLGVVLETMGRFTAADSTMTEAVRISRTRLGTNHYRTAFVLAQLGGMLVRMGDHERAEASLREALAIGEGILDPYHRDIGVTLNQLGRALQEQGDLAGAEPKLRRAVAVFERSLGENHPFTGITRTNLAYLLHLRGSDQEAEHHFREGLEVVNAGLPEGHDMIALSEGRYGEMLVAQARYEEAEPLLQRSYEVLVATFGAAHPDAQLAARRLVALYAALGVPGRAVPYIEVLASSGMP
jgi:eukaryotic-like serine/threonine-protein kinase